MSFAMKFNGLTLSFTALPRSTITSDKLTAVLSPQVFLQQYSVFAKNFTLMPLKIYIRKKWNTTKYKMQSRDDGWWATTILGVTSDTVGRWGGIRFPLQSKTDAGS